MTDEFKDLLSERDQLTLELPEHQTVKQGRVVNIIRTSDRILFKRCRRRWAWSSHLRYNLGPIQKAAPLWLGSGFHFAMEDYHGERKFSSSRKAFLAYCKATQRQSGTALPENTPELIELGVGMLEYYDLWLKTRDPLKTFVFEGVPQCEVNFKVKLPWTEGKYGIDEVYYSGQIDRVIEDENGLLWLVEYKTAKAMATTHFLTDPQIGSYCWGAANMYGMPVAGVIYQQHRKDLPRKPRILANGKLSAADSQLTTHRMYREEMINIYGSVNKAPPENVRMLNNLAMVENEHMDAFVRRDKIQRNEFSIQTEGVKILMEVDEMLDPNLALYPNPTRQCAFECPFGSACVSLDDGSDWEYELQLTTTQRDAEYDSWRAYLVPEDFA